MRILKYMMAAVTLASSMVALAPATAHAQFRRPVVVVRPAPRVVVVRPAPRVVVVRPAPRVVVLPSHATVVRPVYVPRRPVIVIRR